MSVKPAVEFNRSNLRKLLASVGSLAADTPVPAYTEFDWRACRMFTEAQMEQLSRSVWSLGPCVGDVFSQVCRNPFEASVEAVRQVYVGHLQEQLTQEGIPPGWVLGFGPDRDAPCALLYMPHDTAGKWASILLGDTGSDDEEASTLSTLEESLLTDLCRRLVAGLRDFEPRWAYQSCACLDRDPWPVQWEPMKALVQIEFAVRPADTENGIKASLIMPASSVMMFAGKQDDAEEDWDEASDCSDVILRCMENLPVSMTAQLGTVCLTFEELMSLRANDVLVLDQSIHEPIAVHMEGRTAFAGFPGKRQGHRALLITQTGPGGRV